MLWVMQGVLIVITTIESALTKHTVVTGKDIDLLALLHICHYAITDSYKVYLTLKQTQYNNACESVGYTSN